MKYASFLPGAGPREWIAWAQRFEAAGFDSLWQGEVVNSALVPLAAVAASTARIRLGSGVNLAFCHSPVMLALAALDMDIATAGRFVLGLGVAHPKRNNDWYAGRDDGKPLRQMREYLQVVRTVMEKAQTGGELRFEGEHYRLQARDFFSRPSRQPRAAVPVYLAAVRPGMARLAGELADGLIGNPLFSVRHVREVILPAVTEGLHRGDRERSSFELLGQCNTVIENDLSTAYRIASGVMVFNVWARIYDPIFAAHGFEAAAREIRAAGRGVEALDRVPSEMIDAFCAVGPVDRVRARIREREGLLDSVILTVPSTGTTSEEQSLYRERILQVFGAGS